MKQFQKLGSRSSRFCCRRYCRGCFAHETGDLAIIPYYTVLDGVNTGMHIINTTDNTQVVKVRQAEVSTQGRPRLQPGMSPATSGPPTSVPAVHRCGCDHQ